MQLELEVGAHAATASGDAPRVLALCVPELPLQRVLRVREAGGRTARVPLAVERQGRIVACDPEARACGVRSGDGVVQGRAACAGLEIVPVDEEADRALLESLAEALLALAPTVEVASDTLLLDAGGAHLLRRGTEDGEVVLAQRAVALAADLGLRCRAAVASGRSTARALARHGGAALPVAPGAGATAMSGLPLEALELDATLAARLAGLGLRQVGDLTRFPPETLAHRFGPAGLAAWRVARGDDPSPLIPHVPRRLPEEGLEFEAPLESAEPLLFALKRLCDRVAARLLGRGLGATRLVVLLRLDPTGDERLEVALAAPSSAAARWLLVLRERIASTRLPGGVLAATLVVAEAAAAGVEQLAIGDRPERLVALETVLARLTARLGAAAVFAASPVDRHRPEAAYAAGSFAGGGRPRGGPKARRHGAHGKAADRAAPDPDPVPAPAGDPVRPTRLLERPQPLITLGEGGRLSAVRLGGRTLRVLAFSPAERLSGEWWSDPFDRDYHRAHLEGLGSCWVFRDAADGRLWLHGFFD